MIRGWICWVLGSHDRQLLSRDVCQARCWVITWPARLLHVPHSWGEEREIVAVKDHPQTFRIVLIVLLRVLIRGHVTRWWLVTNVPSSRVKTEKHSAREREREMNSYSYFLVVNIRRESKAPWSTKLLNTYLPYRCILAGQKAASLLLTDNWSPKDQNYGWYFEKHLIFYDNDVIKNKLVVDTNFWETIHILSFSSYINITYKTSKLICWHPTRYKSIRYGGVILNRGNFEQENKVG